MGVYDEKLKYDVKRKILKMYEKFIIYKFKQIIKIYVKK